MFRGTLPNGHERVALLSICLLVSVTIGFSGCSGLVNGNSTTQAIPTPLTITVSSLPSGTTQAGYSATLSVSGGTAPYSWSITAGSLPPGLTLSPSGHVSGTPTASGTSSFTVKVTDSSSPLQSATASLSIVVAAAATSVQITTTSLPSGQVNSAYSGTLAASGGTAPYTWTLSSGLLPTGLSLGAAGQISGTPTASGTSSFTVKVTDSSSPLQSATASLSIVVAAAATSVQITTSSLPGGQVSSAYLTSVAASGGTTPYTWSLSSGSLPAGLILISSGQISGIPTTAGTSSFAVTVTDSSSPAQSATANLSLTITVTTGGGATVVLCPNNGQTGDSANCAPSPALTFGKQGTSTPSAPLTISVNNCSTPNIAACTGTGSLTLGSPYYTVTGANAGDFSNTGLGTCSNGLVVISGSDCTIVLRFTPSQASGTNESATLTVNSNGVNNPDTMSLTGTSATVTTISSCQSLSSNTNYQLTASVSAPGTCFTAPGSNTDLNLNGFTVTYCTSSSSSLVGGVFMNGNFTSGLTVHNGTIVEGPGTCTGLTPSNGYGSGAIIASSDGQSSASRGTTVFNVTATVKAARAKVIFEENAGNSTALGTTIHDVIYTDNDSYSCGNVGCRDLDQGYPIVVDQSAHAGPSIIYNVVGVGGTQGGIVTEAANSVFNNDLVSPGDLTATNSNGFIFQDWATAVNFHDNLTVGSGAGGTCLSCRGVQISSAANVAVTGSVVQNNVLYTTNLNNNAEYGGCQIDGSYGMQINTAGSNFDLSNNTFQNNRVYVTAKQCPGLGFSYSGATNAAGPNRTKNNTFVCNRDPNATSGANPCAGIRFDANQYSPHPDNALISSGDTFLGDTSAIYIWYDGTPSWTCNQCTFGKGSNPISGWVMLDYDGGGQSGQSSNPMFLIDPIFTGGATKDSNNLGRWAPNNPSLSFSYTIQRTYTVTVKGSTSGSPLSGATVTVTDAQGQQECNGTTNASGVFSCVANDTKYGAASGQYSITNFNPLRHEIRRSQWPILHYQLQSSLVQDLGQRMQRLDL